MASPTMRPVEIPASAVTRMWILGFVSEHKKKSPAFGTFTKTPYLCIAFRETAKSGTSEFSQKGQVCHLCPKGTGEMVEWSITPVLKTGVPKGTGGSNPSLSAKVSVTSCKTTSCADFSFKGAPNLRQNFSGN